MLFIICVTWCQKLSLHLHGVRVEPTLLLRSVDITMAHVAVGIPPLQIDVRNAAKSWRTWRSAWTEYEVATDLDEKTERKRVSTLLSVIGREAKDIWENYHWINESDRYAIQPVLQMYTDYCTPKVNVPFERHMFHSRKQQPDEDVMAWYSQMPKIGANCAFDEITSDEIYRVHLVSGVYEDSVREKLLERRELTLETVLDIIRNSEIKIETCEGLEQRRRY